ncbi:complement factor H-like isoform X3 [Siniperca chuatsi]|uniref:complement factor H-like isoform X3 n=1 Tax=Siniperca chuatsi TaxID=119488 RepID=UPI001CE1FB48|nr:complement factor H-like isoform X3 [Siniperca chuatsi]
MRIRYLGFALLTWFPGVLHAQSAAQPCSAPSLRGGFFAPKQETYSPETKLTYTCDNGRKPTVKGWWATSTCQNGKWSHEPQCIDEEACIPPEIPNAKYTENQNGWYENGHTIRITCDQGYEPKDRDVTARCITGTWSSVPVCERSIQACGEPPKIPHAVIIHQEYQEVFAVDSEVQYECEDGYTVEEADGNKSIFCIAGSWTEGPTCRTGPGTGHSGSTVGGTDGTQPGGGSSTTSGFNDRDSRPLPTTIDHCGAHPNVPNGIVVQVERKFLKYQCNAFYTQVGSDTVTCSSNGKWSQLPICKEAFCVLDLAVYKSSGFKLSGVEYVKEGETKQLQCIWVDWWRIFRCTNGRLTYTQCCHANDIYYGRCR